MCLCMYPRPARPASAVSSYNEALRGGVVVAVCTRHYLYIGSYFDSRVSAPRPPLKQRTKCSTVEQRRKGGRALRRGRRWRRRGRRAAAAARGRGGRVALRASRARLPFARGLAIGSAVELCGAEAAALTVWGLSKKRNPGMPRARLSHCHHALHPPGTDSCRKAEATTGSWCALGTHWHCKLSWHSRPRSVYIGTHLHS